MYNETDYVLVVK